MKRKWMVILLVCCLAFVSNAPVKAATTMPEEALYDLSLGGTQSFVLQDEFGKEAIVVVEELPTYERVAGGTYKVSYEAAAWTAGFTVVISNNMFTSAHSPYHKVLSGSISEAKLTKNSSVKATYAFRHKWALITWNTGVLAQISNGKLVVSKK